MNTKTKILFSACTVVLLSGCSLSDIPGMAIPSPTPMDTPAATALPVATPMGKTIPKATGAPDEQVNEYMNRVRESQKKLEEKFEKEAPSVMETPAEDIPAPSVTVTSWFASTAYAEELPSIAPVVQTPGTVVSPVQTLTPLPVVQDLSVPELLTSMELNISGSLEALQTTTNPQEALALLGDIQNLQDEVGIFLSGIKSPEYAPQILEVKNALDDLAETVDTTISSVEESITNGESTVNLSFETTLDALPVDSSVAYPLEFDHKAVQQKKIERLEASLLTLRETLVKGGMTAEKADSVLANTKATLETAKLNPESLWKVREEVAAIQILSKRGIDAEKWQSQKQEWKTQKEADRNERQALLKDMREKVSSGTITKVEAKTLLQEEMDTAQKERTDRIYEKISAKNPAAAEQFLAAQEKISAMHDMKKSVSGKPQGVLDDRGVPVQNTAGSGVPRGEDEREGVRAREDDMRLPPRADNQRIRNIDDMPSRPNGVPSSVHNAADEQPSGDVVQRGGREMPEPEKSPMGSISE
ncbi:MAG: hypothetical protein WCJ84_03020 [Candidatus Peregrinibacteria bacterium]